MQLKAINLVPVADDEESQSVGDRDATAVVRRVMESQIDPDVSQSRKGRSDYDPLKHGDSIDTGADLMRAEMEKVPDTSKSRKSRTERPEKDDDGKT